MKEKEIKNFQKKIAKINNSCNHHIVYTRLDTNLSSNTSKYQKKNNNNPHQIQIQSNEKTRKSQQPLSHCNILLNKKKYQILEQFVKQLSLLEKEIRQDSEKIINNIINMAPNNTKKQKNTEEIKTANNQKKNESKLKKYLKIMTEIKNDDQLRDELKQLSESQNNQTRRTPRRNTKKPSLTDSTNNNHTKQKKRTIQDREEDDDIEEDSELENEEQDEEEEAEEEADDVEEEKPEQDVEIDQTHTENEHEMIETNQEANNPSESTMHRTSTFKIRLKSGKNFEEKYLSSVECEKEIRKNKPEYEGEISTKFNYSKDILTIWTNKKEDIEYFKKEWPIKAFKYGVEIINEENISKTYHIMMKTVNLSEHDEKDLKIKYKLTDIERWKKFYILVLTDKETYERINKEKIVKLGTFRAKCESWIYPAPKRLNCRKCFSYYHMEKDCDSNRLCKRCGKKEHGICKREPICINCEQKHEADDIKCPIRIQLQREDNRRKVYEEKNRTTQKINDSIVNIEEINQKNIQLNDQEIINVLSNGIKSLKEAIEENSAAILVVNKEIAVINNSSINVNEIDELCDEILGENIKKHYKKLNDKVREKRSIKNMNELK
ncbi:unnamed protein product [Brachionus calyciflorus]|uniref:Uncharacterized protein n=1 Tax=Brachionus calyciflorus TaxID=104777 RepID=A0A814LMF7_9BILA|nr:unnamed protein product [Brachionus calyciflorus]